MVTATTTTNTTTLPDKKIIAVIGATGAQGGGLVRAILADRNNNKNNKNSSQQQQFIVRALTRDPTKDKAVELSKAGAEVVAFDIDDPQTHSNALKDVYGLFVVTNFWEHMDPHKEDAQCKAVVKAGKEAGVEHFIWSTLDDTTPFFDSLPEAERPQKIKGYYTPHFDVKAKANAYFPEEKTTFLYTSFYLENFYNFGMVNNGVFSVNLGDAVLPIIGSEDIGKCAYGIFKAANQYKGKEVYIAGDKKTCQEIMEIVSDATQKSFSYAPVDHATYAAFGFPGADDLANMFEYNRLDPDCERNRDVELSKKLNPELQDCRTWALTHAKQMLPLAAATTTSH